MPKLIIFALLLAPALGQDMEPVLVGNGVGRLMQVEFAPGVTHQLYIAERDGRIWRMLDGELQTPAVLDITDRVAVIGEGGLLGFEFDPEFATNGYLYVSYSTQSTSGDTILSRFSMLPGSVDEADPNSETILFGPFVHETRGHKAGDIEFGPDGLLYYSVGDGNDGDQLPLNYAQDLSDPRGSILRLDVREPHPHVPDSNPFVGQAGVEPLIWAYGLRNPFRIDIDDVTGDVYLGDVGAGAWEEVNRLPGDQPGLNCGWRCREGVQCTQYPGCPCVGPEYHDPIARLAHSPQSQVCAVIGGIMVRGGNIPFLEGRYVFSDFCSGKLFAVFDPAGVPFLMDLSDSFLDQNGQPIRLITDFEQAPNGDIYFVTQLLPRVWRLRRTGATGNYCSTVNNSSGRPASIAVSGSTSLAERDLTFEVTDLPPRTFGTFLMSTSTDLAPFGASQGTLCVGQPLHRWRYSGADSGVDGRIVHTSDLTDLPPLVSILPGDTWYFQYWTRDANPAPTSNTSNGAYVTFTD